MKPFWIIISPWPPYSSQSPSPMAVVPKCWQATKQASHRALCPLASSLICWFNARKMPGWLLWRRTQIYPLGKLLFSSSKAAQLARTPGSGQGHCFTGLIPQIGLEWAAMVFQTGPCKPGTVSIRRLRWKVHYCLPACCVLCLTCFSHCNRLYKKTPIFSVFFFWVACFLR